MEKKFFFVIGRKKYSLKVKECKSFLSKGKGLMFSTNNLPLLFIFNQKNKLSIHSFFCKPFIAIWFDDKKIIDIKNITNWRLSIKPKEKFNILLEIPIYNKNYKRILDDIRKI